MTSTSPPVFGGPLPTAGLLTGSFTMPFPTPTGTGSPVMPTDGPHGDMSAWPLPEYFPGDPNAPQDSLQANVIASSAITWVIAAIFVGMRFYTRGRIIRVLGASDWVLLLALAFSALESANGIQQGIIGRGKHVWNSDMAQFVELNKATWFSILWYVCTLSLTKVAILLLYIHIFTLMWVRRAGQIILAIVIVTSLWAVAATLTACIPLQAFWDPSIRPSFCQPYQVWWGNTGLHMVTDFLIFLLPLPAVWKLRLPLKQKVILFGVFALGFFVCFISVLRLVKLADIWLHPRSDFTYDVALGHWTVVEVNAAIVCACLMTLKPLMTRMFPRYFARSTQESNEKRDGSGPQLTIGSKRSHARGPHRRTESWIEDLEPIEETWAGMEMEGQGQKRRSGVRDLEAGAGLEFSSNATLQVPPDAKVKLGSMTFYESSTDKFESRPDLAVANKPPYYDSSSERTDWGPEVRDAIR